MPSRIVGGIGMSHVPSVGVAVDRGNMQTPAWKPLWDAYGTGTQPPAAPCQATTWGPAFPTHRAR